MKTYVALIACADRAGLVHEITGVLFRKKVNVTENQEFVDHGSKRFFMRVQFEGRVEPKTLRSEIVKHLPAHAQCAVRELAPRRLVVLASRELHCLGDLLLRHHMGEINAEICAVISQHENAKELTRRFGLKFFHVPVKKDRLEHEVRLLDTILPFKPDYLVLARYMRIFSEKFVAKFPNSIVNIHHSFLPAFIGRDPYHQAHARGVKIIGATSHFVTANLDEGPIITQNVAHVDHTSSPETMARLGQDTEKLVLASGLDLVLNNRVLIEGNRTIIFE